MAQDDFKCTVDSKGYMKRGSGRIKRRCWSQYWGFQNGTGAEEAITVVIISSLWTKREPVPENTFSPRRNESQAKSIFMTWRGRERGLPSVLSPSLQLRSPEEHRRQWYFQIYLWTWLISPLAGGKYSSPLVCRRGVFVPRPQWIPKSPDVQVTSIKMALYLHLAWKLEVICRLFIMLSDLGQRV